MWRVVFTLCDTWITEVNWMNQSILEIGFLQENTTVWLPYLLPVSENEHLLILASTSLFMQQIC